MKNIFKKNDLFKILFLIILVVSILTWIFPSGSFTGAVFQESGVYRISIFDFFLEIFYSAYYFLLQVTFLLAVGCLYGVLSKSKRYSYLVYIIAKKIKGRETIFSVICGLLLALLASFTAEPLVCILFVPFILSILTKNNISKIKGLCITFGSILVGVLGVTYGVSALGYTESSLGLTVSDGLGYKFAFLGISFVLLMLFTHMLPRAKKQSEVIEDRFELVEVKKKESIWPLIIVLVIVALLAIIGYIPWETSFNTTFFADLHTDITTFKIGEHAIFGYLLGSLKAIGEWDLYTISLFIMFGAFVISLIEKMKLDDFLAACVNGAKRMAKPIFIYLMVNCLFVISYWSPILPNIVSKIMPTGSDFNLFKTILVVFIGAILVPSKDFMSFTIANYFAALYSSSGVVISLVINSIFGFVQLLLPTSAILVIGLSYLNISYKEYLSKMWKFLLGLLFIVVILLVVAAYI